MACPCAGATMMSGGGKKKKSGKRHCPKACATSLPIGTRKTGLDGKTYVVKRSASTGSRRWSAVKR